VSAKRLSTRLRAVAYARYSSEQQRAASIEDQLRNFRRRANDEGWTVVREFADRAITGADSSRPQYREMLAAAERSDFVLLVHDLSRLARDQVESERAIRRLEFRGIRIVATTDGYNCASRFIVASPDKRSRAIGAVDERTDTRSDPSSIRHGTTLWPARADRHEAGD
jgi:hypothetical protein